MPEKHFTLLQLNKSIQKLIQNVQQDFWITAELASVQVNEHAYLELVQKEKDKIVAKARAIVWNASLAILISKFGDGLSVILRPGSKVLVKVTIQFHEVYGLSLVISDLDAAYTIGELELQRQQTLLRLEQGGLLEQQKALTLQPVLQRLAVISSASAAGYADFLDQLYHNPYRYTFQIVFFPTSVQGERAEEELLGQIQQVGPSFDAAILIRGGGSRLDLEVFNSYAVAEAVAHCPVPVLAGIGHLRDTSVTDVVAHLSLKTPTAVAEFIIRHNAKFELELNEHLGHVLQASQEMVNEHRTTLQHWAAKLGRQAGQLLQQAGYHLDRQQDRLQMAGQEQLKDATTHLRHIEQSLVYLDPQTLLRRGYTITMLNGVPLKQGAAVKQGDELLTITPKWQITSTVTGPPEPI